MDHDRIEAIKFQHANKFHKHRNIFTLHPYEKITCKDIKISGKHILELGMICTRFNEDSMT